MVNPAPSPVPGRLPAGAAPPASQRRWETVIAIALLACIALVAFWEFMANRSRRPFEPFALTAQSFSGFAPQSPHWTIRSLEVAPDPVEPNILALLMQPHSGGTAPILVRLVHGYNMVDCMRIKGEQVDLIADTRGGAGGGAVVGSRPARNASRSDAGGLSVVGAGGAEMDIRQAAHPTTGLPPGIQLWRLTTPTARVSLASTAMLRAGDFAVTEVDTRAMAFPRVDIPDNPGWFPQGLTWRSLRHPIQNGRLFLRAKWNSSRADLMTFLGLRQPAWASEELLTLVASTQDSTLAPRDEAAATARVVAAHQFVLGELQTWVARREAVPVTGD